jgi:hypothetical protein
MAPDAMTAQERAWNDEANAYRAAELDYFRLLTHKPQTVAFALRDSPIGCAAWMLEKFRSWSDCGGELDAVFSKDDLITNLMLYVATGRSPSSRETCSTAGRRAAGPSATTGSCGGRRRRAGATSRASKNPSSSRTTFALSAATS